MLAATGKWNGKGKFPGEKLRDALQADAAFVLGNQSSAIKTLSTGEK